MTKCSAAEANEHLSDLIERTLAGDDIVMSCHGDPVVSPQALRPAAEPVTSDDLDWLAVHRVRMTGGTNAGALLRIMRDEDER